jgi:hypothetical protein
MEVAVAVAVAQFLDSLGTKLNREALGSNVEKLEKSARDAAWEAALQQQLVEVSVLYLCICVSALSAVRTLSPHALTH